MSSSDNDESSGVESTELQAVQSEESGDIPSGTGRKMRRVPSRYRRIALGLVAAGALAAAGGVVFADAREVLFSLAMVGLTGALLATVLDSDRFVPDVVAERLYDSIAMNHTKRIEALGLPERGIYVPTDESVVLFVPETERKPSPAKLEQPWSTDDEPALVLEPTGEGLFQEVHRKRVSGLEPRLEVTAGVLAEGLVEVLELAHSTVTNVDPAEREVSIRIAGAALGDLDRFDHPIASYLAVGFARKLDRPVTVGVRPLDGTGRWLIICSWELDTAM